MIFYLFSGRRQHDRVRDGRGQGGRPVGSHRHYALRCGRRNREEEGKLVGICPMTRFALLSCKCLFYTKLFYLKIMDAQISYDVFLLSFAKPATVALTVILQSSGNLFRAAREVSCHKFVFV